MSGPIPQSVKAHILRWPFRSPRACLLNMQARLRCRVSYCVQNQDRPDSVCQEYHDRMNDGRDHHVDREQDCGLRKQRSSIIDEGGKDRQVKNAGLRIEQIGDKALEEKPLVTARINRLLETSGRVTPSFPRKPEQIECTAPAQKLIGQARCGHNRGEAKGGCNACTQQTYRDACCCGETRPPSGRCCDHGEIAMLGPGVSSISTAVTANAKSEFSFMVLAR